MPQSANRGLAAWPIRRKLITLVAVPILVIVAAGAWLTTDAVRGLRQAERTRSLAVAALTTNQTTVALDNELTRTLLDLRHHTKATHQAQADARIVTDKAMAALTASLDQAPSGGWSSDVLMATSSMKLSTGQLPGARQRVDAGSRAPLVIQTSFQSVFTALRNLTSALSREIATTTADGRTVDQASMLAALAAATAAAADERALGTIAITDHRLGKPRLVGLTKLAIEQDVQLQIAYAHASPEQQADIDAIRMDDDRMKRFRDDLDELASGSQMPVASDFSAATGQRLENMDTLVGRVAEQTRDSASATVRNALIGTILLGGLTALTLLLIFATLAAIARTVTGPMRRLRSGAVEVATVRLPQAVRQIEQQGVDATIDLPPVMPPGTVAGPETLEVAHAVDGLTAEAVRLATAQVRLRHALDEAFVSMSRRSQTMVEKQLAIIDDLESTEEDPEQLRNLFRLDHLAARMRRYNDNLLVLAGSSVRTRSNTPVPVSDVFRAATSEMEQYERVRLQPVNSAAVAGPVAGGLIHLLAELLDNAAMYSPPTSPILLTAAFTPGGGLHLEVTDSGVGIPPAELAELNARLATPGTIDTQIPSRMGLFVVGRLAQRGGFEVRLSARASAAGTVAEVLVPAGHVVGGPQGNADLPQQGRGPAPQQRTPSPLSPQGLPAQGVSALGAAPADLPGLGLPPSASPPAGLPPAPAGAPPSSVPGPSLPRRPNLGWPGADQATTPRSATGPSTGSLPSRVPGAALSGGPLSARPLSAGPQGGAPDGGRNTGGPDGSPFDAFGARAADLPKAASPTPPPPATPIGPSSATAAWSSQARAARIDSTSDRPGTSGRPGIPDRPGTPASPSGFTGSPTGRASGGSSGTSPNGPPSGHLGQSGQSGQSGSGLPIRTPSATYPPSSGATPPSLPPRPVERSTNDATTGTPPAAREADHDQAAPPSLPTRPTRGGDPFATAKLFGVEMPDPATAAGLFTAGPKVGAPDSKGPGARVSEPGGSDRPGSDRPEQGHQDRPADRSGNAFPADREPSLTGELPRFSLKPVANPSTGEGGGATGSNGTAPAAWEGVLPKTQEAPDAETTQNPPAEPDTSMIGNLDYVASGDASPIFESMSVWFSDQKPDSGRADAATSTPAGTAAERSERAGEPGGHRTELADQAAGFAEGQPTSSLPGESTGRPSPDRPIPVSGAPAAGPSGPQDGPRLIDLRSDSATPASTSASSRWASLGDQQWLAANARAAAAPQIAGDTSAGLPRREPGANLLPSAASAAPGAPAPSAPFHRADADAVRGRLGSFQRGVSSARQSTSRHITTSTTAASLFTAARTTETDQGHEPDEQRGEQ
jgi:signal transduction histidine kinase